MGKLRYKRVLLKLSGEELIGDTGFGIDPKVLKSISLEIRDLTQTGAQVGIVLGGGNLFRGKALSKLGLDRVAADHMGMLATVMNAIALRDILERTTGVVTHVMSAITSSIVSSIDLRLARKFLDAGQVVIFSGGTGNPFFTTDSAACLRAVETHADIVIKATKVEGVYSQDPMTNPQAVMYESLTYDQVIEEKLKVMDTAAICMCRDHSIPICVLKMSKKGALVGVVQGQKEGTIITGGSHGST